MVDQLFVVVVSVEGSARPDIAQPVPWQPPTEVVDR
jgi:hypothetical protein